MNTRRSYIDTVNAGRQRRPDSSLEQLSRSLENLEHQLEMRERARPAQAQAAAAPRPRVQAAPEEPRAPAFGRADPYASADTLSTELRALRDEMRQQMNAGLRREFETLRGEIQQSQSTLHGAGAASITTGMERLADTVHTLAERHDDKALATLRGELQQVKSAIAALAREETVQTIGARWDDIDHKLAELQLNLAAPRHMPDIDPALAALNERLDQIGISVNRLPESLSLDRIEDRVRNLTTAVDRFSRASAEPAASPALSAIENRLEEISRAIVATSMAPQPTFDAAPFERIEARLNMLARQFAEADRPGDELLDGLGALASKIEGLSRNSPAPDEAIEKLTRHIGLLTEKIAASVATQGGPDSIHELEDRLAAIMQRLDEAPAGAGAVDGVLRDLDHRMAQIARKLDETPTAASASDEAILGLQKRLDFLARKIDAPARGGEPDTALMRSLESQLGALSGFLANSQSEAASLAPRLDRLEANLSASKDDMIMAAREAAEYAVRNIGASGGDAAAAAGLTHELKSLEELARRSDDRNAKTFEAVHDTLMKIVDRLGAIESAPAAAPRKLAHTEAPPLAAETFEPYAPPRKPASTMSPAQMAAAAAAAALSEIEAAAPAETVEARAPHLREKPLPGMQPAAFAAPEVALDAPLDPQLANQPLEPGTGAPDLSAILSRVRAEQGSAKKGDQEAARTEFLAAARRAAQAAAAEAEVVKRRANPDAKSGGSGLLDLVKAKRKVILMGTAAVVAVILAMQVGKSFFADGAAPRVQPVAIEQPAKPAVQGDAAASAVRVIADEPAKTVEKDVEEAVAAPADVPEELDPTNVAAAPAAPKQAAPAVEAQEAPARLDVPKNAGPEPLREAATAGDAKALFELGSRYAEGRVGGKPDMAAAAKWYEQAAELGFAPAQYRVGNFYEKGIGVERDLKKAKTWYQMSADQGNASAMHNLAVLFASGGEFADNEGAARWFGKAANLGVKDSQYNLGILSGKGIGMSQNLEDSYKWFALVAKTGDTDAAAKRDEIANSMRPEQLAKAKASVEAWKAETLAPQANSVDIPESWRESDAKTASVDMKKAVRNVQALLNKAGYDAGSADGAMGAKTKNAIAKFQKDNGIDSTGEINEQTVKALLGKN